MSSARTHAGNLLATWSAIVANFVVMFFLSPFIVGTLGKAEYGIWSLLNVLTGYMGILDLGVRAGTGRFIILYIGREDHRAVDETVRTGLGFFTAAGGLLLAASLAIGIGFPVFFPTAPAEYHGLVRLLLPLMALNLWLSSMGAVYASVLTAHDRIYLSKGVDFAIVLIRGAGTLFALLMGLRITGLAVVAVVCGAVGLVGNWYLARRVYPQLRSWPVALYRKRIRELLGYGLAAFVSKTAGRVTGQTALVVVGACIGVAAVTTYSVGAMLVFYFTSLLGHIGTVFFPPVQRAAARNDLESVRWYYLRQLRMVYVFGVPIFVGFAVFGESFVRHWMLGPEFPEASVREAGMVMAVLAVSRLVYVHIVGAERLCAAMGRIRFTASVAVVEALATIGLSVFLAQALGWGLMGVAWGAFIARTLIPSVPIAWLAIRLARLRIVRFTAVMARAALSAGVFAAVSVGIRASMPDACWADFFLQAAVALVLYVPVAWCLLVPPADRKRLLGRLGLGRKAPAGASQP